VSLKPGNKTILIVEDDPILIELFDEILSISYATRIADNIGDAITIIQEGLIDAVISDYRLGSQNANTLVDLIVQESPELASKTIILTGDRDLKLHHHDKIASVLFKPIDFNSLKQEVHNLFNTPQEQQS